MKRLLIALIVIAMIFYFTKPALAGINDGLVAYYPFNGNANDESGNGNHGTVFGATLTDDRFGNPNTAYYFDGVDNYIEIMPQTDVSAVGDFTISVWTYLFDWKDQPMDYGDRQYIFDGHSHSKTVSSNFFRQGFFLIYDGNPDTQQIHDGICYDNNKWLEQNTEFKVKGKWLHHVFLRRGDTDYTYINGESIFTTYVTGRDIKSDELLNMQHYWFIGTFSGNNPNYVGPTEGFNYSFYGLIDDVRIYNRALSESEIQGLYGNYFCEGDFDNDRDVDGSDLAIFAGDFGRTDCPMLQQENLMHEIDMLKKDNDLLREENEKLKAEMAAKDE